jgi:hypothetical protein
MSNNSAIESKEDLRQSLEEMFVRLDQLGLTSGAINKASVTDVFMQKLLHVYLLLKRDPSLFEVQELQNFLRESAPRLAGGIARHITKFQMEIEDLFSQDPDYDPWEQVCYRRSAFEALRELYQDTQDPELKRCLDLSNEDWNPEDIDFIIEQKAVPEPIAESNIPAGMPRSHWWWWGEKAEIS